jgi:hypothetical protein
MLRENRRNRQKPVAVPLCSPQIQIGTGLGLCSMVDSTLELLLQPCYFSIILAIDVNIFRAHSVFV